MAQPGIEVKGLEQLLARFKNAPQLIEAELEDAGDTVLALGIQILTKEPTPPSGSRYHRTGRLVRGWKETDRRFAVQGNARSVVLRNPTPYTGVVQSRADQARVHRGRWPTIEGAQEQMTPFAEQKLQEAGDNVAAALAGN